MILAWLTGARPFADPSGTWQGANLPRGPVAVLAWERECPSRAEVSAGHLDAQATAFAYPWPDPVEVRALE
jgi:hypothetical protein